tara:strand:+ start:1393 stop:3012 length:1620 start_codon:yes stop_codon:yes gene_type:complete
MNSSILNNTIEIKYIVVVSDPGKHDVDDITTACYLREICNKFPNEYFVEFLTIGDGEDFDCRYEIEDARIQYMEKLFNMENHSIELNNFKLGYLSLGPQYSEFFSKKYILQIAPVHYMVDAILLVQNMNQYHHVLQGTLGNSINGNPEETTRFIIDKAISSTHIATKKDGQLRVPLFTFNSSEHFPPLIKEEILRLAWRNTIGRADGTHVNHAQLCTPYKGANWVTVNSLWSGLGFIQSHGELTKLSNIPLEWQFWYKAAQDYVTNCVNPYNMLELEGLTQISFALFIMFGIKKIFSSKDTILGDDCWDYNSRITEFNDMSKAYRRFKIMLLYNPYVGLTPGYDLLAANALILHKDEFNHCFEPLISHDKLCYSNYDVFVLKEDCCYNEYLDQIMDYIYEDDDEDDDEDEDKKVLEDDAFQNYKKHTDKELRMSTIWSSLNSDQRVEHINKMWNTLSEEEQNKWNTNAEYAVMADDDLTKATNTPLPYEEDDEEKSLNEARLRRNTSRSECSNNCVECGVDMGESNPRQYCGKTVCLGL